MNIFVVDLDPAIAAQSLCDKHVVKMTLETAQIMCTVIQKAGGAAPYRATHRNHPCTIWAGECYENWQWLVAHGKALASEYVRRYNRVHASSLVINEMSQSHFAPNVSLGRCTQFAQAMPEIHRHHDVVSAYRRYYLVEKRSMASWKAPARPPAWWI